MDTQRREAHVASACTARRSRAPSHQPNLASAEARTDLSRFQPPDAATYTKQDEGAGDDEQVQ
jgi:hypothetical protein